MPVSSESLGLHGPWGPMRAGEAPSAQVCTPLGRGDQGGAEGGFQHRSCRKSGRTCRRLQWKGQGQRDRPHSHLLGPRHVLSSRLGDFICILQNRKLQHRAVRTLSRVSPLGWQSPGEARPSLQPGSLPYVVANLCNDSTGLVNTNPTPGPHRGVTVPPGPFVGGGNVTCVSLGFSRETKTTEEYVSIIYTN